MDAQPLFGAEHKPDGIKILKELKLQRMKESFANTRASLEDQNCSFSDYTPSWLQNLSKLPPKAQDLEGSLLQTTLLSESCATSLAENKEFCSNPPHVIHTCESHIGPPKYTWCGLLHRNLYKPKPIATSSEMLEIETIRVIPYYEIHDSKDSPSPAETLHELTGIVDEQNWKVCLDVRVCPNVLHQNFYLLLAAFGLESPKDLCEILKKLFGNLKEESSDEKIIRAIAHSNSKRYNKEFSLVLKDCSHAWSDLKNSGQLQEPNISYVPGGSELSIPEIIKYFRLTLPPNKRLMFRDTRFNAPYRPKHQPVMCGICKQFYCEGHYHKNLPNPVVSTARTMTRGEQETHQPCGPDCSFLKNSDWIHRELENNPDKNFENWDAPSKALLRCLKKEITKNAKSEISSACDLMHFFENSSLQCWQLWAAWQKLSMNKQATETNVNAEESQHLTSNDLPQCGDWLNLFPAGTNGYVPCSHTGSCFENKLCWCYRTKTHCDRFCSCPILCSRRYKGCSCVKSCATNCECVKRLRECDPLLCKCPTCGTGKCRQSSSDPAANGQDSGNQHSGNMTVANNCNNFQVAKRRKRTFVAPSKVAGLGLFAGEKILCNNYLGDYTGVQLLSHELELASPLVKLSSRSFLFDLNQLDAIDSAKFGNRTRFINEPPPERLSNASAKIWYVAGTQVIRFFATKDIPVGKEIYIEYGCNYSVIRDWAKKKD